MIGENDFRWAAAGRVDADRYVAGQPFLRAAALALQSVNFLVEFLRLGARETQFLAGLGMGDGDGVEGRGPVGNGERARVAGQFFGARLRITHDHRLLGVERLNGDLEAGAGGAKLFQPRRDRALRLLARGGRDPLLNRADRERRSRLARGAQRIGDDRKGPALDQNSRGAGGQIDRRLAGDGRGVRVDDDGDDGGRGLELARRGGAGDDRGYEAGRGGGEQGHEMHEGSSNLSSRD